MSTPTTARQAGAATATATRPGYRRCAALTAAALTTMAATIILAPAAHAATVEQPVENATAGAAVTDLVSNGFAAIPADFATRFGYQPAVVDGVLANPNGSCSSPVTLPDEFENPCKAHDLGYDLLRYADAQGQPLGGWARQSLDTTLGRHMHEACASRPDPFSRVRCDAMASIAGTFVDLNSRRQDYGAPVIESLFDADRSASDRRFSGWLIWVIGSGVLGLGAALIGVVPAVGRGARVRGARTHAERPTVSPAHAVANQADALARRG